MKSFRNLKNLEEVTESLFVKEDSNDNSVFALDKEDLLLQVDNVRQKQRLADVNPRRHDEEDFSTGSPKSHSMTGAIRLGNGWSTVDLTCLQFLMRILTKWTSLCHHILSVTK